jgi:Ribbon-helix-helix protein, copG family
MHQQTVSLTEPQIAWLRAESARLGISVSDMIRRIIDEHRERAA